jgi:hypothetical protein
MKMSGTLPNGSGLRAHATPSAGAGSSPAVGESVLERRYPGVVRALILMWGYPELTEFLNRVGLGLDERLRDIEPAAMAELMLLAQIHRSFCAGRTPHAVESHPALRASGGLRPAFKLG